MRPAALKIIHRTSYRVIYGDTDQMGVVYYANYLRWFEQGRSEFLRQIGLPYATIEAAGYHFPVIEVSCRYLQSARYDDVLAIETGLSEVRRASLLFQYRVLRSVEGVLLADGFTRHACIDQRGHLTRVPGMLEEALSRQTTL